MAGEPLVSVVTPTWGRHDLLLDRCVPSVAAQSYGSVEHVIVSDGPDPALRERFTAQAPAGARFEELPGHQYSQWGHYARLRGIELAKGDYIAFLDDDNAYRPEHIGSLVTALEAQPDAGFAYSQIMMHQDGNRYVVGAPTPCCGGIDTSAMMCRREALDAATWQWYPGIPTIDWDLAQRWMQAGLSWVFTAQITADYYFAGVTE